MGSLEQLRDTVSMIGLLKVDQEKLEEQTKILVKIRKEHACQVFSTKLGEWTPFHAFALKGCRKLIKLAIKSGVDVNLKMGKPNGIPGHCSALHLAAHRGDVSIIKILVENGANVNQTDTCNKTPIYYASANGNILAVKALKKAGANVQQCVKTTEVATKTITRATNFVKLPFSCVGKRTEVV